MIISIGIHIQDHILTIAEVLQEGTNVKINEMINIPLSPKLTEVQKRTLIIDELEKKVKLHQKNSHRFCFSLPQSQVSTFQASFPFKEKFKILKTIPFELEDKSPFKMNEVVFDIRKSMHSAKTESDIICFLTPTKNVNRFMDFVKMAKISPHLLSSEGSAVANLIEGWNPNLKFEPYHSQNETLYIYLGHKESLALFFSNKILHHIFTISWGFQPIVHSMMNRYHLNFESAYKEFLNKAFILTETEGVTKEQKMFSSLIKKEISHLVDKLKILKLSLETESKSAIQEACVLGPGSAIQNLSSFLSDELSFPVTRMKQVTQSPSLDLFEASSQTSLVAVGTALEGLKRPPYEGLNLMRSLRQNIGFLIQRKWKQALSYVAMLLVVFTGYATFRDMQNQKISDKTHEIFTDYSNQVAFLPVRKATIDSVNDFLNTQDTIQKSRSIIKQELSDLQPIDHLKMITQNINKKSEWNLKITFLSIKNKKIIIAGHVNNEFKDDLRSQLKNIAKKNKMQILQSRIDKISKNIESQIKKIKTPSKKTSVKKQEERLAELEELKRTQGFAYSFTLRDNL